MFRKTPFGLPPFLLRPSLSQKFAFRPSYRPLPTGATVPLHGRQVQTATFSAVRHQDVLVVLPSDSPIRLLRVTTRVASVRPNTDLSGITISTKTPIGTAIPLHGTFRLTVSRHSLRPVRLEAAEDRPFARATLATKEAIRRCPLVRHWLFGRLATPAGEKSPLSPCLNTFSFDKILRTSFCK